MAPADTYALRQRTILAKTFFEKEPLKHGRAAQLVLKTLSLYQVVFENVVAFSSDSASYMVCCFTKVLQIMFENCVQLQCLANNLNLVIKSLLGPFE